MKFYRYGTYQYVGYDSNRQPIIDVERINSLRGYAGVKYIVDWKMMHAQEVWSVNFKDHVRHCSRQIEPWTPEYPTQ